MANTATITAPIGPGLATTAQVFNDVHAINVDLDKKTVTVIWGSPQINTVFSYATMATVTWTISGASTTITMST